MQEETREKSPKLTTLLRGLERQLPGLRMMTEKDDAALLRLYETNPFYNAICLDGSPTLENCRKDRTALPPGKDFSSKLFLGYFLEGKLQGVWDLIDGYPEEGSLYVGLLELDGAAQGKGLGHKLMDELIRQAECAGFSCIRLACLEDNAPGLCFWKALGFTVEGRSPWEGARWAIKMVRALKNGFTL